MTSSPSILEGLEENESFIFKWQYRMLGDFYTSLINSIMLADETNLKRLAKGFPVEVDGYILYTETEGWWREVITKAKNLGLIST